MKIMCHPGDKCFNQRLRWCKKPASKTWGLCALLTVGLLTAGSFAGSANARPLEEELLKLIETHPKIKEAEMTLESQHVGITAAQAGYYPTVSLSGDIGPEAVDNPGERASSADGETWRRSGSKAGTTITQNLFDGFRTSSQVRSAKINREVAALSLEGARQNIVFEAIRAYTDVLRQQRLVEMSRENERTIQRQLNLEDERVRRGSGIAVDVLQAKTRLQLAKERRVGFEGATDQAISRYVQVFGHAPELDTMTDPSPSAEIIPSTVERALEIALNENPALLSSATTVVAARERKELEKSGFYPKLDLVGSANVEKHKNTTIGMRRDYSVLLKANWDIFSGTSTLSAVEKSNFDYQASKENYDYVSRKITEQVYLAWHTLLTARERKQLLGNAVNIATEVFDSRRKLRDAGKETVINVLDAENEVNNAQINYTTAAYDERTTVYQLLLSMGRLNPEYLMLNR